MKEKNYMNRAFFLILIIACFSCASDDEEPIKALDQIVLIIDKCPNYSSYYNADTKVRSSSEVGHEITYRDDDLIFHAYNTSKIPTKDTIVFPARSELIEIEHVYKLYNKLSFIFQKGDTVLFTYENDFPAAKVLNRESNIAEDNYEKIRRNYILNENEIFDGVSKFHHPSFVKCKEYIRDRIMFKQCILNQYETALNLSKNEYEMEKYLLDSLYSNARISKNIYIHFKTKLEFNLSFVKYKYLREENEISMDDETNPPQWEHTGADSLIRFGYYNSTLDYQERKEYYSVVPWTIAINKKTPDYRIIYDSIRQSNLFTDKEKKVLLTKNMKLIIENFPTDDIEYYFTNYRSNVSSNALVQHVYNEYRHMLPSSITKEFEPNVTTSSDTIYQLSLLNRDNEPVDFKDILEKHKGKLIYVDFWATHCLPCLIAMPHSGALKMEYKNKNIQFLYISIDKDKEKWEKSEVNSKIIAYPDSYILDHEGKNAMLEYFNIKSIPRYMLFDEHGILVQNSSFGPSTDEIRKLFDKHISG